MLEAAISITFFFVQWSFGHIQLNTVCLFGVFRPTREFFTHFGDVTIADEGLQFLTYVRHS